MSREEIIEDLAKRAVAAMKENGIEFDGFMFTIGSKADFGKRFTAKLGVSVKNFQDSPGAYFDVQNNQYGIDLDDPNCESQMQEDMDRMNRWARFLSSMVPIGRELGTMAKPLTLTMEWSKRVFVLALCR